MHEKPCPRCGTGGDVVTSGKGLAMCRKCQGSFVSTQVIAPALLAAGMSPQALKDLVANQGSKLKPCPICANLLTTFSVRRETLHACFSCNAIWADDGAMLRLAGIDPAALAATLPVAAGAAPAPSPAPRGGGRNIVDRGPQTENPLGDFAPPPAAPIDDTPFKASVGAFSERGGSGAPLVGLALKLGVAAIFLGGLYFAVKTAFMKGEPTRLGGGYEALFWNQPIKTEKTNASGTLVTRMVSPWGTNTLEAVFVPGGGGGRNDDGTLPLNLAATFHGRWVKVASVATGVSGADSDNGKLWYVELEFVDERDPNKSNKNVGGYCRYYYNNVDGWLLCGFSDSNLFPRSGKSVSFVSSLRKSKAANDGARAKAAVGVVEVE